MPVHHAARLAARPVSGRGSSGRTAHTAGAARPARTAGGGAAARPRRHGPLTLTLILRGRQMVARLRICGRTWLPKQLTQPLAGGVEAWHFGGWTDWPADRFSDKPHADRRRGALRGGPAPAPRARMPPHSQLPRSLQSVCVQPGTRSLRKHGCRPPNLRARMMPRSLMDSGRLK